VLGFHLQKVWPPYEIGDTHELLRGSDVRTHESSGRLEQRSMRSKLDFVDSFGLRGMWSAKHFLASCPEYVSWRERKEVGLDSSSVLISCIFAFLFLQFGLSHSCW
jgi:hypothetical protein